MSSNVATMRFWLRSTTSKFASSVTIFCSTPPQIFNAHEYFAQRYAFSYKPL